MSVNHGLGVLEGETGTPMSSLEFAARFLAEALQTPDTVGYDANWILASQLLFNSAPLGYSLRVGVNETEEDAAYFELLDRRADGRFLDADIELQSGGPWPVSPGSQVADFIISRVEHYVEVMRADLMKRWAGAGNREHAHMYVRSTDSPGRPLGGPLTEDEVWERLLRALDFMEVQYPVSTARHRPRLTSADDFTRFLRWKLGEDGRHTWDLLTDYRALLILQAMPRHGYQQAVITKDLKKAEAAWDRRRKKVDPANLEQAA
jgi:hypothetical protein